MLQRTPRGYYCIGVKESSFKEMVDFENEGLAEGWRVDCMVVEEEEPIVPVVGVDVFGLCI